MVYSLKTTTKEEETSFNLLHSHTVMIFTYNFLQSQKTSLLCRVHFYNNNCLSMLLQYYKMHLAAVRYCIKCLDTPSCFDEFHLHIYIALLGSVSSAITNWIAGQREHNSCTLHSFFAYNILLLHIITKINVFDYWLNIVSFTWGWMDWIDRSDPLDE